MTNEKIEETIAVVEAIKKIYESERDEALGKIVTETENGVYPYVDDYLYILCEIEWLGREIKRLHSEYAKNILEARDGQN